MTSRKNNSSTEVNVSILRCNSRWKTVEIFLSVQKDGSQITAGLFDDIATIYWLDLYKKAEIDRRHAAKIKKKLTEGTHYISISKSELEHYYPNVARLATLDYRANEYVFLTEEGWYRAIQGIGTDSMDNQKVAANIDRLKDEMASIYAKYRRGEFIPVSTPLNIHKIQEKRDSVTNLNKQVGSLVEKKLCPIYRERNENPQKAFSNEHRALNEIVTGVHERDQKNKLNSTGLDVSIATRISDITLLKADILDDATRWGNVKEVVDDLYPDRDPSTLKLSDREQALIQRGCDETQKSLFEFKPVLKQLAEGSS